MDKTVQKFWDTPYWKIPGTTWEITGYSRAAYRTGFYIKNLDLMIDAGPQKIGNPKTILVTHSHGDHIANIPFTLIKQGDRCPKVTNSVTGNEEYSDIFLPEESKEFLNNYICAMFASNFNSKFKAKVANWFPVKESYSIDYVAKNQKIKIDVYKCFHDIPTVAYGLSVFKKRLKSEYHNLKSEPDKIKELKKSGVSVTEDVYEKAIVFVWDTKIKVLEEKTILEYPVVMIECTFLLDSEEEISSEKSHIHWKQLKPYVVENPSVLFVLVHFSMRYKSEEIVEFFEKEGLENVKPWVYIPNET